MTKLKALLFAASLLIASTAHAGHVWVAGIAGIQTYPNTANFVAHAGCPIDTTTYAPLPTYACTANATGTLNQGVLIESQWFDASATQGNAVVTLHLASQEATGKTTLWKAQIACDNGAYSAANPTFGTESATFTCTNDSTVGKEITCISATITPASVSLLGGANLAWTCLWDVHRVTGGTLPDATAINIIGYELDIQ